MVGVNFLADVDAVVGDVVEGDVPDDVSGLVVNVQLRPTTPVSAHIWDGAPRKLAQILVRCARKRRAGGNGCRGGESGGMEK